MGNTSDDLDTVSEIFTNATLPPDSSRGPFGVCYVAYAGTHDRRYRGERLLEVAATQVRAAAAAVGTSVPQCLVTDQPERPRPYIDLVLPLRSSADATPFLQRCADYTRRFERPCKLYFGYMAKAVAVLQSPYETTVFLDTDTFVCSGALLSALPRLASGYDVLLSMPRTSQGWLNSGVLVVRRDAVRRWAPAWLDEFASLDDFGDQLHLLKVLPAASAASADAAAADAGRGPGGGSGALRVGELPPELHLRQGSVPDATATAKLPAVRGPVLLLHSKGLASLTAFDAFFANRFGGSSGGGGGASSARGAAASRADDGGGGGRTTADVGGVAATSAQLASMLGGDGQPEGRRPKEKAVYSARTLAGFCLLLLSGGSGGGGGEVERPGRWGAQWQWVLNTNGTCVECAKPPRLMGAVGAVVQPLPPGERHACAPRHGSCGVRPAVWPSRGDPGLPAWYGRGPAAVGAAVGAAAAAAVGAVAVSAPPAPTTPTPAASARGGVCKAFCARSAMEWPKKCRWRGKCDACAECPRGK